MIDIEAIRQRYAAVEAGPVAIDVDELRALLDRAALTSPTGEALPAALIGRTGQTHARPLLAQALTQAMDARAAILNDVTVSAADKVWAWTRYTDEIAALIELLQKGE